MLLKNYHKNSKLPNTVEGIFGGLLLGVRSVGGLALYDWETTVLVRRIEIIPKNVGIFHWVAILIFSEILLFFLKLILKNFYVGNEVFIIKHSKQK